MSNLTQYEERQLKSLRKWQAQPPDWGTRLLSRPTGAAGKFVQTLVPESALHSALQGINSLALKLSGEKAVLKAADVSSIEEMREVTLEVCDRIATREQRRAMTLGGASGMVFGVVGAAGLVADVPTLLMLAMRTVHRTGLCYGEEAQRHLAIGIFALASANSAEEKTEAIAALANDATESRATALLEGLERAAQRELAKEAAVFSLQTLARRIGINLGARKAASSIPVFGAAVGAAVNAWYVRDVAIIARRVFQERWLLAKYPELARSYPLRKA